jgi:putative ABC transport system substrate-binding protein
MNPAATEREYQSYLTAFIQEMRRLGWIEGQNLQVDVRWAAGDPGLAKGHAEQLVGMKPDVILAVSTNSLRAIQHVSKTLPVVFVQVSDPVAQGFVSSVSRPDGNITGFSAYEFSVGGKWLGLLKEAVPQLHRVIVMFSTDTSQAGPFLTAIEAAAAPLGAHVVDAPVRMTADIERILSGFAGQPAGGLILPPDSFTRLHFALIAKLAERYNMPSIAADEGFAKAGGLMEYGYGTGIDLIGQYREAARYVVRILKGAKPSDLPVQAPTKYRLAINGRTATSLSLTIPETLLATADEVIQ